MQGGAVSSHIQHILVTPAAGRVLSANQKLVFLEDGIPGFFFPLAQMG